ncbi:MAG: dihydroxy-acid dehydratase [Cytophagales bacterium]|nr:MAG: dihydroxy-acid dehydratase [Cytophagales bacterium]
MKNSLRSHKWFYGANETGLLHKGALWSAGIDMDNYHGQPIIGIANTWSQLNNCNMSLKNVAEEVKKGIHEAGGIALEFPVISLGEELMKPSAMLYRNLLSIDVEENIRAYPIDGVILLGNCDKTVPGLLMGAVSANMPIIQLNAGPKEVGIHKGKRLGSGTDLWKYWDKLRVGEIDEKEWNDIGKALSCGFGACNTMGTASTMNGLLEALGLMPLGMSTLPVTSEKRKQLNIESGKRIVQMVHDQLTPDKILTIQAFSNAISTLLAIGGSTNAIIHLTAIAGRLSLPIFPNLFDELGRKVPCITNVQPNGALLIDEFNEAGGIPSVLNSISEFLHLDALTYTGLSLRNSLQSLEKIDIKDAILELKSPLKSTPTLAVLKGNLAPNGAVIKVSAASAELLTHKGKAVVFENYDHMLDTIDDDGLIVDKDSVLVLKNAGPVGVPGMPEWGMIPVPKKLKAQGVNDMVRISDSRMSGTSFGTVILHVAPEAAVGGVLAIVKNGDLISINVPNRSIELHVSPEEIDKRFKSIIPKEKIHKRGYPALYIKEVTQANKGCDFDFLIPKNESERIFVEPIVGRS